MKKVNWTILTALCVVFFAAPVAGAAGSTQLQKQDDSSSYWSLDARVGLLFDKSVEEIQCQHCYPTTFGAGGFLGLDLAYNWDNYQAGVSGTVSPIVFGGERYSAGATGGWQYDLAHWLKFHAIGELGIQITNNFVDGQMFGSAPDDSDIAILPFLGARVGLDVELWPDGGLMFGVWGSGQIDLYNHQREFGVNGFGSNETETYTVGGYRLATGVNLGFEF